MKSARNRWQSWVETAWVVAGAVVLASAFLIYQYGEAIPFGAAPAGYQPNIAIWAMGVGQSLGAILGAVLFSMVNSIYQASIDLLEKGEPE